MADDIETELRNALETERRLTDRLAMCLVNSQVCEAPLMWVFERADALEAWTEARR